MMSLSARQYSLMHLEACPFVDVSCKFAILGCQFVTKRKEIGDHMQQCPFGLAEKKRREQEARDKAEEKAKNEREEKAKQKRMQLQERAKKILAAKPIQLIAGGKAFTTTVETLCSEPGSLLAAITDQVC